MIILIIIKRNNIFDITFNVIHTCNICGIIDVVKLCGSGDKERGCGDRRQGELYRSR